jgi:hypothetical protein
MMQPGRANVGAAVIALGAEHPWLQIAECHAVGEPADVQFGVVGAIRIAAIDEHVATPAGSHVGPPHGLIVEYKVRNRPGHAALKRGLSGSALVSGPVVSRGAPSKP